MFGGGGKAGLAEHNAQMEGIPQQEVREGVEEPNHVGKKSDLILSMMGTMGCWPGRQGDQWRLLQPSQTSRTSW